MRPGVHKVSPGRVLLYLFLSLLAMCYILPLVWLVFASLKDNTTLFADPFGIPSPPQYQNYVSAWVGGKVGRYFLNSVVVVGITLVCSSVLSSMAAYGISRMKWKASGKVLSLFLLGMMVPVHATLIPLLVIFTRLRLINTYAGLILPYTVFAFAQSIFIMTGFLSGLPRELEEAAVIDGCSLWRAFWTVILPVSKSGLFTILLFTFNGTWNELLVSLVFTSSDTVKTLPAGLSTFVGMYSTNYAPMLAAIVLAVLPTIVIYCSMSNRIAGGLTAGAVKG